MTMPATYVESLLSTPRNYACTPPTNHLSWVGHGQGNGAHSSGPAGNFLPPDYRVYAPNLNGLSKDGPPRALVAHVVAKDKIRARTLLFDAWRSGSALRSCGYLAWASLRKFARHTTQTIYHPHQQPWAPCLRQLPGQPLTLAFLTPSA